MKKFDLPLNFVVEAKSESQAEQQLIKFLKLAMTLYSAENGIVDWDFVQFIPEEGEQDIGVSNLS